jgi:hypothetical protein
MLFLYFHLAYGAFDSFYFFYASRFCTTCLTLSVASFILILFSKMKGQTIGSEKEGIITNVYGLQKPWIQWFL